MRAWWRPGRPTPGMRREQDRQPPTWLLAGAFAGGCGPRRCRPGAQWHKPPGEPARRRRPRRSPTGFPAGRVRRCAGEPRKWPGPGCARARLRALGAQAVPASQAPTAQDRTPGACRHPVAKPVVFGPFAVVGLVGALHFLSSLLGPAETKPAKGSGRECCLQHPESRPSMLGAPEHLSPGDSGPFQTSAGSNWVWGPLGVAAWPLPASFAERAGVSSCGKWH